MRHSRSSWETDHLFDTFGDTILGNLNVSLTGTVSQDQSSATVTGSGTTFSTELKVGNAIEISGETFTVQAIGSNTSLTTTATRVGTNVSGITAKTDTHLFKIVTGSGDVLYDIDGTNYKSGVGAGSSITNGIHNNLSGNNVGATITSGSHNSFFGFNVDGALNIEQSSGFGYNLDVGSFGETVVGRWNTIVSGTKTSWVATDRAFVVGVGENTGNKADGLVILKNQKSFFYNDMDVTGVISATSGTSTQWNTAYSHSQSTDQHVPSGGTAGQVLSKASATNYDLAWVDNSGGGGTSLTLGNYKIEHNVGNDTLDFVYIGV